MPLAQVKGLSGYLSAEQKAELIRKVTDVIVSVEGEGLRPVTWVIVEEVPSGQWGVGGTPVTTEALKHMAAQGGKGHSLHITRRSMNMQFPIHTKETAPESSRATLTATEKKYGFLPNLFGVLAESPTAVQAYAAINKALEQSALSPVEQQVVTLVVSTTNDCAYCVGAHSTVAQMVHMPEDILSALREQRQLPDRKLNALKTLVMSVLLHRGWVPDEDLEFFTTAGYGQQHLLDVLTIVALKTLSNYTNHIAHTPLDPQFVAQAWKAKVATGG